VRHDNASDWSKVTFWCCDSWPDTCYDGGEMMAQPTRDIPQSPHQATVYYIPRPLEADVSTTNRHSLQASISPLHTICQYTQEYLDQSKYLSRICSHILWTGRKSHQAYGAIVVTQLPDAAKDRICQYVVPHCATAPSEALHYLVTCPHRYPYGESRSNTTHCRD
jgi:hypothetical protein